MKKKTIYTLNVGDQDYEDMQGNLIFYKAFVLKAKVSVSKLLAHIFLFTYFHCS